MSAPATNPRVAVITATYNRPDALRLAMQSVLAQTFQDFEYWVIGDACDERTAETVAGFDDPRVHYFNRARNSGSQAAPNNDGFERSSGELIAYLGHDDLWFPWHLSELVAESDASGAELVYGLTARFGPGGLVNCVAGAAPEAKGFGVPGGPPSSWLVQRRALAALGGWLNPLELGRAVDMDVLYRLAEAGQQILGVPRLSVLKFPSHLFPAAYRREAALQAELAAELRADPEALEHRLLCRLAQLFAWHRSAQLGWRGLLKRAARLLGQGLTQIYGPDRWPLPAIRVRRYQNANRRRRTKRGLPRDHGEV